LVAGPLLGAPGRHSQRNTKNTRPANGNMCRRNTPRRTEINVTLAAVALKMVLQLEGFEHYSQPTNPERLVFQRPYGLNAHMASAADDALACPACGYDMECVRWVRRWPQDQIGVFRCVRCTTQVSRLAHRASVRIGAAQHGAEKIGARA
jgi:hypothetical protein